MLVVVTGRGTVAWWGCKRTLSTSPALYGCRSRRFDEVRTLLTLGAHAQRGLPVCLCVCVCVCVCVCYSQSHLSNVRSSHKRYDLLNGQRRSEISNSFL